MQWLSSLANGFYYANVGNHNPNRNKHLQRQSRAENRIDEDGEDGEDGNDILGDE